MPSTTTRPARLDEALACIDTCQKAIVDSPARPLIKALGTLVSDDGNTILVDGMGWRHRAWLQDGAAVPGYGEAEPAPGSEGGCQPGTVTVGAKG